jgi:hypothetical protein
VNEFGNGSRGQMVGILLDWLVSGLSVCPYCSIKFKISKEARENQKESAGPRLSARLLCLHRYAYKTPREKDELQISMLEPGKDLS